MTNIRSREFKIETPGMKKADRGKIWPLKGTLSFGWSGPGIKERNHEKGEILSHWECLLQGQTSQGSWQRSVLLRPAWSLMLLASGHLAEVGHRPDCSSEGHPICTIFLLYQGHHASEPETELGVNQKPSSENNALFSLVSHRAECVSRSQK